MVGGDFAILKGYLRRIRGALAQLLFKPRHPVAGGFGGHQKRADTALARAGIAHRKHNGEVGVFTRGDELLGAIEQPALVGAGGTGADRRGV